MKTALRVLSIFFFLCLASSLRAAGKESGTAGSVKSQMSIVRDDYLALEHLIGVKPVDYPAIQKVLDDMEASAGKAREAGSEVHMRKSFADLMNDIRAFRAEARRKSVHGMENALSGLYENCFRCHLTHSQPRSKAKSI